MDRSSRSSPASSTRSFSRRETLLIGTAGGRDAGAVGAAYTSGGTNGAAGTDDGTDDDGASTDLDTIAHRGFAGENPENTVAAAAAAAGVRG